MRIRLRVSNRPFNDLARDLMQWGAGDVARLRATVAAQFGRNFARQGSAAGPWATLSRSTIRDRVRRGYASGPILVRSGRYRASWRRPDVATERHGATIIHWIGSDSERAPWHEFGTRIMPARPVAELGEPQIDAIEATVEDILERLANG